MKDNQLNSKRVQDLLDLAKLHRDGLLTEQEFVLAKAEIFNQNSDGTVEPSEVEPKQGSTSAPQLGQWRGAKADAPRRPLFAGKIHAAMAPMALRIAAPGKVEPKQESTSTTHSMPLSGAKAEEVPPPLFGAKIHATPAAATSRANTEKPKYTRPFILVVIIVSMLPMAAMFVVTARSGGEDVKESTEQTRSAPVFNLKVDVGQPLDIGSDGWRSAVIALGRNAIRGCGSLDAYSTNSPNIVAVHCNVDVAWWATRLDSATVAGPFDSARGLEAAFGK